MLGLWRWRTIRGKLSFDSVVPLRNLFCANGEHEALTLRQATRARKLGPACLLERIAALTWQGACSDMVDVILFSAVYRNSNSDRSLKSLALTEPTAIRNSREKERLARILLLRISHVTGT